MHHRTPPSIILKSGKVNCFASLRQAIKTQHSRYFLPILRKVSVLFYSSLRINTPTIGRAQP